MAPKAGCFAAASELQCSIASHNYLSLKTSMTILLITLSFTLCESLKSCNPRSKTFILDMRLPAEMELNEGDCIA